MWTACRHSKGSWDAGEARWKRFAATSSRQDWSPSSDMPSDSIRLGAVGYLNARPLVYGLESHARFDLRYDIPSVCARLLHAHETDVGLIPSIEYLRGPAPYRLVPGPAVTSRGPVASVAMYTRRDPKD